jgi:lysophospholipase L1-like esterase
MSHSGRYLEEPLMRARTKPNVLFTFLRAAMIGLALICLAALAACGSSPSAPRPAANPTATHTASVVYVALGASDAVGVGAADPNTQGYVPVLISRLPKDADAINLGVSGYKVHDALQNKIAAALNARPTLVTIWLAGNDFRGCTPLNTYIADLNALLDQLKSGTKAQVFVANLPDMSLLPAMRPGSQGLGVCHQSQTSQQMRAETQAWNTAIAQVVNSHGDDLIDLYRAELASHPEYISGDGFHPTAAGYLRLADLFWADIQAKHAVPAA